MYYKLFQNSHRSDIVKNAILRTQKNDYYKLISKRATELAKMRKSYTYCLNLEGYKSQQKQLKEQDKYFRDYKYQRVIDTAYALPIDLNDVKNDVAILNIASLSCVGKFNTNPLS